MGSKYDNAKTEFANNVKEIHKLYKDGEITFETYIDLYKSKHQEFEAKCDRIIHETK